jgi:AraC-like DNA-binding protein
VAAESGCGVLRHAPPPGDFRHVRYPAPAPLREWVEHFWFETWSFPRGTRQLREMLPHPSIQLVFARGAARIYGVQLGRFTRELQDQGQLFGVRFWPGAFRPFVCQPVATLANRVLPAECVLSGVEAAAAALLGCDTEQAMTAVATSYLLQHLPPADPNVAVARCAVQQVAADRSLMRVRQLAVRSALGERALQRLFHGYVGASARWVIKRYRTYEALEQLRTVGAGQLADLAQRLGYFDQAHFTNDFSKRVGQAPAVYLKR